MGYGVNLLEMLKPVAQLVLSISHSKNGLVWFLDIPNEPKEGTRKLFF